jgi:hypothetical protein
MVSLAPLWRQVGKDCSSIHFSRPYCYAGASCQSAMPPYSLGVDTLTLLAGITPIHCSWELRLRSAASGVVRGGWPWPCMHGGPEGGVMSSKASRHACDTAMHSEWASCVEVSFVYWLPNSVLCCHKVCGCLAIPSVSWLFFDEIFFRNSDPDPCATHLETHRLIGSCSQVSR